ncbi:Transcriptional regulatory protein sin3 [Podochytrium sp. JEL0797]|nr:Transcriptional regulatory protein sin3 [Podochytrium sp. JEL0797]
MSQPPQQPPSGPGDTAPQDDALTPPSRLAPLSPQLPVPQGMAVPARPYALPNPIQLHHTQGMPQQQQQQVQQQQAQQQLQQQQQQQDGSRSLNVKDALSYLDQVKAQFFNQPDVYNRFLDIMKDFKSQSIDTPGVIDRVSSLFRGHPSLVTGFNTFLPPGYRIEATMNPLDPIRVYTPQGLQPSAASIAAAAAASASATGGPVQGGGAPMPVVHSPPVPHFSAPQMPPPQQQYFPPPQNHPIQPMPGYPPQSHPLPPPHAPHQQQQQQAYAPPPQPMQQQPPIAAPAHPDSGGQPPKKTPVEFGHAISYVNKIKNRFANEPDTYKQFLEILQTYQKESKPIQEVYAQVQVLFKGAPDLLDEFKHFLPEVQSIGNKGPPPPPQQQQQPRSGPAVGIWTGNDVRRGSGSGLPPAAQISKKLGKRPSASATTYNTSSQQPQQPYPPPTGGPSNQHPLPMSGMHPSLQPQQPVPLVKKRKYETNRGGAPPTGGYTPSGPQLPGPGSSTTPLPGDSGPQHTYPPPPSGPNGNVEELEWIDRCKRSIGNKATYNEFLKVLNLFSNEIIDAKTLVERVEPFLQKSPDLFQWFKKFVKYEEEQVVYNYPAPRPEFDPRTCRKSGNSYRQLPDSYPRSICSGRDAIAREVLNDDWISQPEYISETGFIAHKKTVYEEALHKCEEERYEFDMNIEANLHTIALLEPIYRRIQTMGVEERAGFRLLPGLGGTSKTIYQRVIKKIYDTEKGLEVIDALHNNPGVAIPVVLKRLKQKDEEWKRCQREWNKVWREVDLKNYHKALDHQGINFKATDRRNLTLKSLTTEIEMLYREQLDRKRNHQVSSHYGFHSTAGGGVLTSSAYTRHQMDFGVPDAEVFRDARKLVMSQVAVTGAISTGEEERIGEFLNNFLERVFFLDGVVVGEAGVPDDESVLEGGVSTGGGEDDSVSVSSAGDVEDSASAYSNGGGSAGPSGGQHKSMQTLRKEVLLKQAAAFGGGGNSGFLAAGNGGGGMMDVDGMSDGGESVSGRITMTHGRGVPRREMYPFFANTTFYAFFRLYEILCSRLRKMKELSDRFQKTPPHHTSIINPIAVSLGLQTPDALETVQPKTNRYTDFLTSCHALFASQIESTEFEDRLRGLFGTSAYLSYTIDKLVAAIVKQIQSVIGDAVCMDLVELYFRDRDKSGSSLRQESVYRLNAERVVEEDALYRLEYHVNPKILTFQLINKDDPVIHEGSSIEEKWSVYVDQFIQLSAAAPGHPGAGGVLLQRRGQLLEAQRASSSSGVPVSVQGCEPFLRRNLPVKVPLGPLLGDVVETRSGLELKICLNTYKMYFVEDTEDYFARRKVVRATGGDVDALSKLRRVGWDMGKRRVENEARGKRFDAWFAQRGVVIKEDEAEWVLVEKVIGGVGGEGKVEADVGDVEMK